MSYKIIWLVYALIFPVLLFSRDDNKYPASAIDASLRANADMVIRNYDMTVDIQGPASVIITEHRAITILNSKGDDAARIIFESSALRVVNKISGYVYDASGEIVSKIKKSDFLTFPRFANYPLYSDQKIMSYSPAYRQYPFTVEYTVEYEALQTFQLPFFTPVQGSYCSLEAATLDVLTHGYDKLKYLNFNLQSPPNVSGGADTKTYHWSVPSLPAIKTEPYQYIDHFATPTVVLALSDFELEGFEGKSTSWNDFGRFVYNINKGRDSANREISTIAAQVVAGIDDPHKKVAALYDYLQKNTRYVLVMFGIGGWQTQNAICVDANKYGDCKGLSNYMKSLLKSVGIVSYATLVYAGESNEYPMIDTFVGSQFNHAILCVPLGTDTVWLDCTAKNYPAGYLGNFTQDRNALLITPSGGYVVHTPVYDTATNWAEHHAKITDITGERATIEYHDRLSGEGAADLYRSLTRGNDNDKNTYLGGRFRLQSYSVKKYDYEMTTEKANMFVNETATIEATGLHSNTGNRHFISLDLYPLAVSSMTEVENRKSWVHIATSGKYTDTFEISIPPTWAAEFIPQSNSFSSAFGRYTRTVTLNDNKLLIIRVLTIQSGKYEPRQYNEYVKMFDMVNKDARTKAAFVAK